VRFTAASVGGVFAVVITATGILPGPNVTIGQAWAGQAESDVVVIAHAGGKGHAPEHTLAAYDRALTMGAEYLEVDLNMTKDGMLVALHDPTLGRTTDVEMVFPDRPMPWMVKDFTLAEIKRLDAGSHFGPQFVGEQIPQLQEIIDFVDGRAPLYIETKHPYLYPDMEAKLVSTLRRNGLLGTVVFQSFFEQSSRRLRQLAPQTTNVQLYNKDTLAGSDLEALFERATSYADGIGPEWVEVDSKLVETAHRYGLIVHTWAVNEPEQMRRLVNLGVDGIFTDYVDRLHDVLAKQ
jgi:glycerophosphoryl diester phosphodiesterase